MYSALADACTSSIWKKMGKDKRRMWIIFWKEWQVFQVMLSAWIKKSSGEVTEIGKEEAQEAKKETDRSRQEAAYFCNAARSVSHPEW